jgi:hypothetical protein
LAPTRILSTLLVEPGEEERHRYAGEGVNERR